MEDDVEVLQAIAASMEDAKSPPRTPVTDDDPKPEKDGETSSNGNLTYPPLPEEPKGSKELCRVGIRLPDGCRIQRKFLQTDPIKVRDAVGVFYILAFHTSRSKLDIIFVNPCSFYGLSAPLS